MVGALAPWQLEKKFYFAGTNLRQNAKIIVSDGVEAIRAGSWRVAFVAVGMQGFPSHLIQEAFAEPLARLEQEAVCSLKNRHLLEIQVVVVRTNYDSSLRTKNLNQTRQLEDPRHASLAVQIKLSCLAVCLPRPDLCHLANLERR
jgi:hypothetical protein